MSRVELPHGKFWLPRASLNTHGEERRVGVEVELGGMNVAALAERAHAEYGGQLEIESAFRARVETDSGSFRVELDSSYLQEFGERETSSALAAESSELVAALAAKLVPCELVTPPLPASELERFSRFVGALGGAGALDTNDSPWHAFGVHFNPELPAHDVDTIQRYLRAFACCQEWLWEHEAPDWTRRLTRFAAPYGKAYLRHLLATTRDTLGALIDDYLAFNPTRNRALDLLPLFAFLDEERVRAAIDDPLVKSRPTLHYRLPNCALANPWAIAHSWNRWVLVDDLANSPDRLTDLQAAYLAYLERDWTSTCEHWLAADVARRLPAA